MSSLQRSSPEEELAAAWTAQGRGPVGRIKQNVGDELGLVTARERREVVENYLREAENAIPEARDCLRLSVAHLLPRSTLNALSRKEVEYLRKNYLWQDWSEKEKKSLEGMPALALGALLRARGRSDDEEISEMIEGMLQRSGYLSGQGDPDNLLSKGSRMTGPPSRGTWSRKIIAPDIVALSLASIHSGSPEARERAQSIVENASGSKPSPAFVLPHDLFQIIYSNPMFTVTGVYNPENDIICVAERDDYRQLEHTLVHEMIHSLQGSQTNLSYLPGSIMEGVTEAMAVKLREEDYGIYRAERIVLQEMLEKSNTHLEDLAFLEPKEMVALLADKMFPGQDKRTSLLERWHRLRMKEARVIAMKDS